MLADLQRAAQWSEDVQKASRALGFVYIIDDDSMVRQSLFYALESSGYAPWSFRSGQDFLAVAPQLPRGCVLLDLRMPDLDGLDVLRQMGENLRRLPVIVITGHGDIPDAVAAMKLGATDFLEKPFADRELTDVINAALERLEASVADEEERVAHQARFARLTPREKDVLQGVVDGLSNKLIGLRLSISTRTVEVHRCNMMARLAVSSTAEAVRLGLSMGMKVSPQPLNESLA
ncbi:response regulator transcription factor [Parablastomonas sp. CN1-191]|uniref:response regulator transcription factor n=1 Tax=Parablastomonas sp. CN1-191 TaxID=3400908 RepID=UPI003BF8522B